MFTEKSLLFKLLSEENIHVVFAKTRTASFDTQTRTLVIPNFAFLSNSTLEPELVSAILDCFGGHEVGHALHTPNVTEKDIKGWGVPFDYVNVIEDCRIERFVKNRYPGMKPIFYTAYRALFNMGFFGASNATASNLTLIDRINLYSKVGLASGVKFDGNEKAFIKECSETITFNDSVALAKRIYEFSKKQLNKKNEKSKTDKTKSEKSEEKSEENDKSQGGEPSDNNDSSGEPSEKETGELTESENTEEESNAEITESESVEDETENSEETENSSDDAEGDDTSETELSEADKADLDTVKTQDTFDNILKEQADRAKEIAQYRYTNSKDRIKKALSNHAMVLNDKIISQIMEKNLRESLFVDSYNSWMENNNKVVNYLVKEFEMKRAAQELNRAVQHSTGLINNKKLYAYKLTDEIFKRNTSLPTGKNHSLTVLVDWSGSMDKFSRGVLRQAITFANFCRKAQIPFNIYLFNVVAHDGYTRESKDTKTLKKALADNEITTGDVNLIRVFHNKMTNSEFTLMSKILFADVSVSKLRRGYTPLNSALLVVKDLMREVIIENKTEKNTLIVISDGANTEPFTFADGNDYFSGKGYIINPVNNLSYEIGNHWGNLDNTQSIIKMIKDELKVNTMWLFLANSLREGDAVRFRKTHPNREESKEFNSVGFMNHTLDSIDVCQIINNKHLMKIDDIERKIKAKSTTKASLQSAFAKMMTSNILNKNLLNQWIKTINL